MISIFMLPIFHTYKENPRHQLLDNGFIAQLTLGNYGGAHPICETKLLNDTGPLTFKCLDGFVLAPNNWFSDKEKEKNDYEFGLYS